jgi:hypothetical protein
VAACKRLGKFAEKHDSLAIYHTHRQFGEPGFDVDTLLSYSSANRLNLDVGHYFGATWKHLSQMSCLCLKRRNGRLMFLLSWNTTFRRILIL